MADRGAVQNQILIRMNMFRYLHVESYQRGSLAPVRYAARAVRKSKFLFSKIVMLLRVVKCNLRRVGKIEHSFAPHAQVFISLSTF